MVETMEQQQPRKTILEATRASMANLFSSGGATQNPADLPAVGDRVAVGSAQMRGTVRFFGPTQFSAGDWVGIELDEPHGKNDGSVKGVRYFECQPMKGLFVRPTALMKMKSPRGANGGGNGQVGRSSLRNSVNAQSRSLEDRAARRNMSVRIVDLAEEVPAMGGPSPANSTSTQFSSSPATSALSSPDKPGSLQAIAIDDESDYEEEKKSKYNSRTSLDNLQELDWTSLASPQMQTPSSIASPEVLESKRPSTPAVLKEAGTMEDRKMALICLERRHKAQKELADAVEDHDVDRIRKLLPMATNLGVPPSELESAQKIYNFEVQQSLLEEIEDVRAVVKSLAEAVKAAEVRAAAVERVANTRRSQAKESPPVAKSAPADGKASSEAWLAKVGEKLEERVWQGLEQRLEEAIRGAVRKATQELVSVASEIRQVRAPVSEERRPSLGRAVPGEMDEDAAARLAPGEIEDYSAARPSLADVQGAAPSNAIAEDAAATKMQAAARGRQARKSLKVDRERREQAEQDILKERSATRIQKQQRARVALKCVNSLREVTYCKRLVLTGVVKREIQAAVDESEKNALASIQEIHKLQAGMEAARLQAQQRIDTASMKIQAVHRGNSARRTCDEKRKVIEEQKPAREKASRRIQLAVRKWHARRRDGVISDLGTAVFAARRKHAAWAAIFDQHLENGSPILSKADFQIAMNCAHPRVSVAQAYALWDGYVVGTGKVGVDLMGFAGIAEAVAIGDEEAAEFADLSRDRYLALAAPLVQEPMQGNIEVKQTVPEAIKRFQRVVNRWMARRRLHGDFDMYTAFRIERSRHKAWVKIFKHFSNGQEAAEKAMFKAGLLEIHPTITQAQVTALWSGFESGTSRLDMDLETFCAIVEAVFIGTDHVAEFADMSCEAFEALGVDGGDKAATSIQARFRGRQSRMQFQKPVVPKLNLAAVEEQTEEQMEVRAASKPAEAEQKIQPTAEESAAMTLQRVFRRQQARRQAQGGGFTSLAGIALLAKRRYGAWVAIFEDACRKDLASGSPSAASAAVPSSEADTIGEASSFESAMREIHPQLSQAQASALWNGYCGGAYYMRMPVSDFCLMAEAVATGDEAAAEFADIPVQTYQMLNATGCDAAAVRIQARYRGGQARKSRAKPAPALDRDQARVADRSQEATEPALSKSPVPSGSTDPREKAAVVLQKNARRWQARRRVPKGKDIQFAHAVNVVRSRHAAWSGIFDSSRSGRAGLDEAGLCRAVSEVYPDLSRGQVNALWQGFQEGTDDDLISLRMFCSILQAVAIGDDAAAEFADISKTSWVALKEEN